MRYEDFGATASSKRARAEPVGTMVVPLGEQILKRGKTAALQQLGERGESQP